MHAPGASGAEWAAEITRKREESKSVARARGSAGAHSGHDVVNDGQLFGVGFFGQNRSLGNLIHDKRDRACVRLEWSASAQDHVCVQFERTTGPDAAVLRAKMSDPTVSVAAVAMASATL